MQKISKWILSKSHSREKLNPINQAQVSNLDFSEGNSLQFTLSFEIVPEIKLPNYEKKFKIKMTKYKSSKEDVDHALEEVRQQHSNLKTVKMEQNQEILLWEISRIGWFRFSNHREETWKTVY